MPKDALQITDHVADELSRLGAYASHGNDSEIGTAYFSQIVDALGDEVADVLVLHFGGTQIYIPPPSKLDESGHLASFLSLETAQLLSEMAAIGGVRGNVYGAFLYVPLKAARKRDVMRQRIGNLILQGFHIQDIAREVGVSDRTIYRVLEGTSTPEANERRRATLVLEQRISERLDSGLSLHEVAEDLAVSTALIARIYYRLKRTETKK